MVERPDPHAELKRKLARETERESMDGPYMALANPDGPDAIAAINSLEAEVARLKDAYTIAFEEAVSNGKAARAAEARADARQAALRWLRSFWMPGSNHDTDEVQQALAAADAALATKETDRG